MHILQFTTSTTPVPAILGGAVQQTIEELSTSFTEKGHKVTVISGANSDNLSDLLKLDKKGINYQYVAFEKREKFYQPSMLRKFIKTIIDNGPYDIVHLHVPIWIDLFNLLRNKIGKPKIIWHVHNRSKFSILANRKSVHTVGISESVLNGIGRSLQEKNTSMIPNIARTEKFISLDLKTTEKLKMEMNLSQNDYIIGFAGRVSPEKGLHVLFDAIEKMEDSKKNKIQVLVAGSSWFKNAKKTEYELELMEKSKSLNINWLGYVDNWDLYKFYNVCNLFVVPSTWEEPAGQVVIEAQLSGTKVLASSIGGIPEFLSPYETIFEAGNSTDLAMKINDIMENEESYDNNKLRNEWVSDRYNIEEISNKWLNLYQKYNQI